MRCTGHCCRCFTLTHTPEWIRNEIARLRDSRRVVDVFWREDAQKVLDMIVPLGKLTIEERESIVETNHEFQSPEPRECYTCKHFDGTNCTNYENRPDLCRRYPNGGRCEYAGCTAKCAARSNCAESATCVSTEIGADETNQTTDT